MLATRPKITRNKIDEQVMRLIFSFIQFAVLSRLSHEVGWKYQGTIQALEAKRKVKSKRFFEKKRMEEVRNVLLCAPHTVALIITELVASIVLFTNYFFKVSQLYSEAF